MIQIQDNHIPHHGLSIFQSELGEKINAKRVSFIYELFPPQCCVIYNRKREGEFPQSPAGTAPLTVQRRDDQSMQSISSFSVRLRYAEGHL